jgi:hypothetical protein
MTSKTPTRLIVLILVQIALSCLVFGQTGSRGIKVATIAPSISTSMEARAIRQRLGLIEVRLRDADAILVVVRSMLFDPLDYSYQGVRDLQRDAEGQLNIAGENFHIYFYQINDDFSVTQLKHSSYKAD